MKWISIKESLPPKDSHIDVLTFDGKNIHLCGRWISENDNEVKFYDRVSVRFIEATHWRYLPVPPEEPK